MERRHAPEPRIEPDGTEGEVTRLGLRPVPDVEQRELIGQTLLGCRIESVIGSGAAGTVFRAHQLGADRPVAVKVLKPHLTGDPELLERFRVEGKNAARVTHENLVTLHKADDDHGRFAIVMEYVEGRTLSDLVRREGPLPPDRALGLLCQACRGLAAAHHAGIIHRDIKPDNLLLTAAGRLKLADFGLAREGGSQRLTQEGQAVGTPPYMSPEQCRGWLPDHRSDLYSLGLVGYYLLTGAEPMLAESAMATMYNQVHLDPEPPHALREGIDPAISAVIGRMLEKDPDRRQPDAATVEAELQAALQGQAPAPVGRPASRVKRRRPPAPPRTGRSPILLLCYLGIAFALGGAVGYLLGLERRPPPPTTRPAPSLQDQYTSALLKGDTQQAFELITRYLAQNSTEWAMRRSRLDLAQRLERHDEAIRELELIAQGDKLAPGEEEVLLRLYVRQKRVEQARSLVERAATRDPERSRLLALQLVRDLDQHGQWPQAVAILQQILAKGQHPGRWQGLASLGDPLLSELAKLPPDKLPAQVWLQLAERDRSFFRWDVFSNWLAQDTSRVGQLTPGLLEQVLGEASRARKWDAVAQAAGKALAAKAPEQATRLVDEARRQAQAAYNAAAHDKAVEHLSRLLALQPDVGDWWYYRADNYRKLGNQQQANQDQARALRLGSPSALYDRGRELLEAGKHAQAAGDLSAAIDGFRRNRDYRMLSRARTARGFTYLLDGKPENARVDFESHWQYRGPFPIEVLGSALVDGATGQQARARSRLVQALISGGGKILLSMDPRPSRLKIAGMLIKLLPDHPLAYAERGNLHTHFARRAEAVRDLQQALSLCAGQHARHRATVDQALAAARR